jgi:hypothetical protein
LKQIFTNPAVGAFNAVLQKDIPLKMGKIHGKTALQRYEKRGRPCYSRLE